MRISAPSSDLNLENLAGNTEEWSRSRELLIFGVGGGGWGLRGGKG